MRLAFADLNLRRNPFGALDLRTRGQLAVVELPAWVEGRPLQFIGAPGRGKTTHLLALLARYPEAKYVRLASRQCQLPPWVDSHVALLVDEAHWLPPRRLRALVRRAGRLALAAPAVLSGIAGAPIDTVVVGGASLARIREFVDRRIEGARRGPGAVPTVSDATLKALVEAHGDDVRSIERALYHHIQRLQETSRVEL